MTILCGTFLLHKTKDMGSGTTTSSSTPNVVLSSTLFYPTTLDEDDVHHAHDSGSTSPEVWNKLSDLLKPTSATTSGEEMFRRHPEKLMIVKLAWNNKACMGREWWNKAEEQSIENGTRNWNGDYKQERMHRV